VPAMPNGHSSDQLDRSPLPPQQDPLLSRHRLRVSLRWWRERRGLTQQQVAEALEWSKAKVVRIESGAVRVTAIDVRALLTLYGVSDDDESRRLVALARAARRRPWYHAYATALDRDYDFYLSYESFSVSIDTFHFLLIPGLLQTQDYARAVMRANGAEDPDSRVALRLERQARLIRESGPALHCVIDEAALYRQVGGAAVMREQLLKLKDAAGPAISVGIIPFAEGAHASMSEPFTLLTLDTGEDVLHQESATRTVTIRENADLVTGYRGRFERLREQAVYGEQAGRLTDAAIRSLPDTAPARKSG